MKLPMSGSTRLELSLAAGVIAGLISALWWHPVLAVLCGLGVLGLVFALLAWTALWPMDAELTRAHARREDANPELEEIAVIGAATGYLAGLIALFVARPSGHDQIIGAALAVFALAVAWLMLHTMYAVRYARIYYSSPTGGIDFHTEIPPTFADFFYFSFTIGMSFAVSDCDVSSPHLARSSCATRSCPTSSPPSSSPRPSTSSSQSCRPSDTLAL